MMKLHKKVPYKSGVSQLNFFTSVDDIQYLVVQDEVRLAPQVHFLPDMVQRVFSKLNTNN